VCDYDVDIDLQSEWVGALERITQIAGPNFENTADFVKAVQEAAEPMDLASKAPNGEPPTVEEP
jgi:hypothetical protein